jgi:tape measure domain-containing protein
MNEKLTVQISADIDSLKAELKKAGYELKKFSDDTNTDLPKVSTGFDKVASSVKNLAVQFIALQSAQALISSTFNESLKLDSITNAFSAIFGSADEGQKQFDRLKRKAEELGLSITSLADSYKLFAGSTISSGMSIQQTNKIFDSVAKTAAVLKLSSQDAEGALRALAQMMSKGTVQSEELKGQFGERIPGAFKLAAKAMGVTTQELGKMLENGQIMASDLLPKLAIELDKAFGDKVKGKVTGLSSEWERFKNKFTLAVEATKIGSFFENLLKNINKIATKSTWADPIEFRANTALENLQSAISNIDSQKELNNLIIKLNEIRSTLKEGSPLWNSYTSAIIEAGNKIKDLNNIIPPATKKTVRSPQEAMLPMEGASELKNEAKELFDLYKQTPDTLKTMGDAYANNPFFRDLINGDIAEQTKKITEDLRGLKETKDTFGNNSIQLVSPEQLANMQNMVTLLGSALTSAFDAALISGQNFGQVLMKAIGDLIKKLLAAVATAAILSVILNAFTGGGAAAVGGFSGILKTLTGFNFGGNSTGNKVLSSVPQRTNEGAVSFEIRGDKLYGVLQNYNQRLNLLA